MRELTIGQVKQMVANHGLWLEGNGGERAVFAHCALNDMDLSCYHLDFYKADFSNSYLNNIVFPGQMQQTNFTNARLVNVSLKNCSLKEATFEQAKCQQINFQGSFLLNTNFRTTKLQVCNFTGTNTTICNLKIYHNGHWPAVIGPEYTTIGCHFHKNEEWKKFNDRRIRSFAYGALPYWNANKTIIFMIMDSFENKENEYY